MQEPHREKGHTSLFSPLERRLLLFALHLLNVDRVQFVHTIYNRRLSEVLATTQFFQNTSFLVFTFEFFQGSFNVFTLFDRHDNHDRTFFCLFVN